MNRDYTDCIVNYERSRQLVRDLNKKYKDLLSRCLGVDDEIQGDDRIEHHCCVNAAYEELIRAHDYYTLGEMIFNYGCENCSNAWSLRCNELANAKQVFGEAKRALSRAGKSIIKSRA